MSAYNVLADLHLARKILSGLANCMIVEFAVVYNLLIFMCFFIG